VREYAQICRICVNMQSVRICGVRKYAECALKGHQNGEQAHAFIIGSGKCRSSILPSKTNTRLRKKTQYGSAKYQSGILPYKNKYTATQKKYITATQKTTIWLRKIPNWHPAIQKQLHGYAKYRSGIQPSKLVCPFGRVLLESCCVVVVFNFSA